ncbi:MAG: hopanoid biosynthesis associated RND transporter like protein HpnN [Flavobacterium sp.]|jgi:hopanoid biosynthesis associated RND transporter like protein HpnN
MSQFIRGGLVTWVTWVDKHARATLILLLLLCLGSAGLVVEYTRINSDLSALIKPSNKLAWYQDNEIYKKAFPMSLQTALLVVSGPNYDEVERTSKALYKHLIKGEYFIFAPGISPFLDEKKLYFLSLENLKKWVFGVEYNYGSLLRLADDASVANALNIYSDLVSSNQQLPLPDPISSLSEYLVGGEQLKLEAHPALYDESQKVHFQILIVKGSQNLDEQLPNKKIVQYLKKAIADTAQEETRLEGTTRIRISGEVALANDEVSAGLTGVGIAGLVSIVLLAIILGFGLRSIRQILMIFILLAMGIILTMALSILTVGSFNTLSLIFVVMFFGLGVDFAVHYCLRVREAISEQKDETASVIAINDIGPALVLCALTSMVAFMSFVPTAYTGLGELGIISAGGMAIAFLLTITLIPAYTAYFPEGFSGTISSPIPAFFDPQVYAYRVFIGTLLLSIIAFYFAKNIQFDYSVLAMRDGNTEAMQTLMDLQREKLVTDYSVAVLAEDGEEALRLKQVLSALDVVGEVVIPADYIPGKQVEKQLAMLSLLALYADIEEVLPGSESLSEALDYLALIKSETPLEYQSLTENIAYSLAPLIKQELKQEQERAFMNSEIERGLTSALADLRRRLRAEPFTLNDLPVELRQRLITDDGRHLILVQPSTPLLSREDTERFINEVNNLAPNIAGRSVVEWGIGDVVVESFLTAGLLSLTIIFFLLLSYFRKFTLAILVLVPIFLSLLFTFAICDLIGISLNMANVLVIPLIIGLGVDTGVHVVHRFHNFADKGMSVEKVYRSSTALAVLISGLTTMGTFFSLSFSPHKGAASIGMLLTIAISLLLLSTFIVLPALLSIVNTRLANTYPHSY